MYHVKGFEVVRGTNTIQQLESWLEDNLNGIVTNNPGTIIVSSQVFLDENLVTQVVTYKV